MFVNQSKFLQWAVWGTLILAILGIIVAYVIETGSALRRSPGDHSQTAGTLPIIKTLGGFTLTNQLNAAVTVDSLKGTPWVANIFFTRCPSICVQMTERMREIQDASEGQLALNLVSISTDPDYDQPDILARYAKRFRGDNQRWSFLTGEKSEVARAIQKELLLAVQENPEESRQSELDLYTHSSLIILVDSESRIRGTYESMGTNIVQSILMDLGKL